MGESKLEYCADSNGDCPTPTCGAVTNDEVIQINREAMLAPAVTLSAKNLELIEPGAGEVAMRQAQALTSVANSLNALTQFVTGGGLSNMVGNLARANVAQGIFQGLTAHDGRGGLDARLLKQNAIEAVHQIEAVFEKFQEVLKAKNTPRDPDLHDAEAELKRWEATHK